MRSFHCHETTFSTSRYYEDTEDGKNKTYHEVGKESFCAGDMAWLLLMTQPNVSMRLGHAMGYINLHDLAAVTKDISK